MIRIGETLERAVSTLRRAGVPEAKAEAEFLLGHILNLGRAQLRLEGGRALSPMEVRRWQRLLARRGRREPLAYVLGRQPFLDIDVAVRPGVFIPRPETEELVMAALELLPAAAADSKLRLLDLCAGSGAIALSLAKRCPGAEVIGVEKTRSALAAARSNAQRLGLKARFLCGDLFSPLKAAERFDLIVSNPPYIRSSAIARLSPEVRREPRPALDGGVKGLDVLERIVEEAPRRLNPGGGLCLEMDPPQTRTVAAWLRRAGFKSVEIRRDLQRRARIVLGRHG